MYIAGGLGDQMSRYALGRYLALKNHTDLFLDTAFYQSKHNFAECDTRFYGLDNFKITASMATSRQIRKLATNLYFRHFKFIKSTHLIGKINMENLDNFKINGDCYIENHFGVCRYWSEIRPILLQEFSLKEELKLSKELADWLADGVVALHCRRGDKANSPQVNQVHGVCSVDYYQQAVHYLQERLGDFKLLIFSDEPDWVKQSLKFSQPVKFAADYGLSDAQELILMSRCTHQITANSSFSQWAAWLNNNENKIVIAPKKLINAAELAEDDLPTEWVRL